MGRLTTIDDMEKRQAAQDDEQMRAAQEAMLNARSSVAAQKPADSRHESAAPASPVDELQKPAARARQTAGESTSKTQAQQETDFHGLNNLEKKSGGHIALIVVAVAIVVVAALKIANVF